ncbi:rhodanese-like domain-containing protein [Clostridium sardiniense]|uniref:Rhodanese-like domain-containing protein n=1 Tax=Clostridium sardiniense TaxID=29369 RepID=A0ABS7L2P0_CLOSR|nr:rhodanese-like domain-containing protein [Clostridium sardiniense]MBY0757294.1 rhodanese-like domain-containing protein [Clostridium sardiniense]MDQ0461618.1 rhodanese-related sulfurtransferase [Clostridium sardiniense]
MFSFLNKKYNSVNIDNIGGKLKEINLIDVREPYEYKVKHVPYAKNIPMNKLLSDSSKYLNKEKEYHIICQSGARSSRVCNALSRDGFKVVNISGGTSTYRG